MRRLTIIGLILVLPIAIGIAVLARKLDQELPELRTVHVEQRDLVITIDCTGMIEPKDVVQVSPDVAGKIVRFGAGPNDPTKSIDVGSRVSKGTILIELDPQPYNIALQKANAAYQLAESDMGRLEAQFRQAQRNLDRANQLRDTNTQSAHDEIVTAHEMASAQLSVGRAKLSQAATEIRHAELNLANTVVRSPIDGVVIDRRANVGQYVSIGHPGLFLLSRSLDEMRIRASVSESDIGKIREGQPATFAVDAYRDKVMIGRVEQILLNARTQGNFVTYDVMVAIDETDVELLPHMTADVAFEVVRRNDAWLVPTGALQWCPTAELTQSDVASDAALSRHDEPGLPKAGTKTHVWVPDHDGKVRPLQVVVGVNDGVQTEVVADDLAEDVEVVVGIVQRTTLARIIPKAKTIR